jgi:DNA-binding beta-propeller fold protein YncE
MDGSGNFYSANSDAYDGLYTLQKWTAASNTTTTLVSYHNGLYYGLSGVTVDSTGNVYFADAYNNVIRELPYAFVDSTPKLEGLGAGNDVLPAVLPATENLFAPFSPTSDQSWLEINGVTNGVVSFSFPANLSSPSRTAHIELLNQTITVTQSGPSFSLGVTAVAEAPSAGNDSVVLAVNPSIGIWTTTSDSVWLHVSPGNQSGMGSTNVVFSFDANPGLTRFGKLTLANLTLTVTQAGSTYVAAEPLTTLTPSGLAGTYGVAVDNSGRTYIADTYNSMIKEWIPSSNAVATLVSSGLNRPQGVAVDDLGNVYIADTENDAIKEWMTTDSNVTTLVSSGLNRPEGVAVDRVGNVYIADTFHSAVKEWVAANSNVITLASSGLDFPAGVAVDIAGNVYIADTGNNVIKQWTPANNTVTTIVSFGLGYLSGVAVDGAGNVYVADGDNSVIEKWTAATGTLATLVPSGLNGPSGVAVDLAGNTYIADTEDNVVKELPRAFVDPNARLELADAGISALSVVLPVFENLLAPFDPTSDQSWLTISGVTNDAVNFSFTANLGSNRTAHIGLLGQSIPVTQGSPTFSLGTSALLEGPGAGNDSVILAATLKTATWTATTGAGWLHLSAANQSGIGSTNVIFTYDTNPGVTRSGTLAIGGQTLTVTQAGSSYVPAGQMTALVSSGLVFPVCVALDGAGNVYFADYNGNTIEEWTATNNAVTTLVSSGLNGPTWVAVDGVGNIYVADSGNNVIKEWKAANGEIVTLVSSGLNDPNSVALDKAGNVYIADTDNNAIKEWNAANDAVTTVLQDTYLVGAVPDAAGNIYILQSDNGVEEWNSANNTIATLIPSGLNDPNGIAVSGQGNVYIADSFHQVIKEWAATDKAVTTTISSGLSYPYGVAVDGAGNLYIADSAHSEIKELPYTFVDPTPKFEGLAAGNASLPPVLPATANLLPPFAPTSDRSWLTITGITNGIVGFSFSANIGPARTAHISLFGQTIPITQGIVGTPPTVSNVQLLQSGAVQISFTNVAGAAFIVQSTTNLSLPLNEWATVGMPTESPPGQYQFIDSEVTDTQRYYVIRSP